MERAVGWPQRVDLSLRGRFFVEIGLGRVGSGMNSCFYGAVCNNQRLIGNLWGKKLERRPPSSKPGIERKKP